MFIISIFEQIIYIPRTMKNRISLVLLLCYGTLIHAQDQKFSATLGYPIPVGDNFLANYSGIADLGVQFRFLQVGALKVGLSINGGYYTRSSDLSQITIKERILLIQPKVYGELDIESFGNFKPFFGAGYSVVSNRTTFEGPQIMEPDSSDSEGSININLGLAYNITESVFAHLQYDYLNISWDNPNQDNGFFTNSSIVKLGIGLRL